MYRGKDFIKKISESLRENEMEMISFETEKKTVNKKATGII